MKFCVAKISYWEAVGFDVEFWRKSTDGTKALCHSKFASTLISISGNANVKSYDIDSPEFQQLIADEFTEQTEEV